MKCPTMHFNYLHVKDKAILVSAPTFKSGLKPVGPVKVFQWEGGGSPLPLENIKIYMGVGRIKHNGPESVKLEVKSKKEIENFIDFF